WPDTALGKVGRDASSGESFLERAAVRLGRAQQHCHAIKGDALSRRLENAADYLYALSPLTGGREDRDLVVRCALRRGETFDEEPVLEPGERAFLFALRALVRFRRAIQIHELKFRPIAEKAERSLVAGGNGGDHLRCP